MFSYGSYLFPTRCGAARSCRRVVEGLTTMANVAAIYSFGCVLPLFPSAVYWRGRTPRARAEAERVLWNTRFPRSPFAVQVPTLAFSLKWLFNASALKGHQRPRVGKFYSL